MNLVIPFIIYVMAMRRKAYLKHCLCEPGPCKHDEAAPASGNESAAKLLDFRGMLQKKNCSVVVSDLL